MRAALHEQKGQTQSAIEGYSHFLNLTGNANSTIHSRMTTLMLRQTPGNSDDLVLLPEHASDLDKAIMLFSQNNSAQGLVHINAYLQNNPTSIQAKLLKVQLSMADKNSDQALSFLRQEIAQEPDNGLWYKTLYALKDHIEPTLIIRAFKELGTQYPKNIHPPLYTADLLLRSTHPARALPYLKKAEKLTPLPSQQALILYQQALIAYDKKDFKTAQTTLRSIIQRDPHFYPAYNLCAYSVLKKDGDSAQAHQLIDTALAHDPNNHHYRDTKAYILYKEKLYAQAEKIFEELALSCHTDGVILKHLAKTYSKQQKHQEADMMFKKLAALAADNTSASPLEKKT
jgi:tetratricopeptide (TPR) repeat protein